MGQNWIFQNIDGNNTEQDVLNTLHIYQFDTGNTLNNPPLPSGAESIDSFFYVFGTLSGVDSDTYNFQSLSGNVINQALIKNFDRIYSVCIQSTGFLVVQANVSGEPTPFGKTNGQVIQIQHEVPLIRNNYDSGWDSSVVGDFSILQEVGSEVFHYELGVLGSLS